MRKILVFVLLMFCLTVTTAFAFRIPNIFSIGNSTAQRSSYSSYVNYFRGHIIGKATIASGNSTVVFSYIRYYVSAYAGDHIIGKAAISWVADNKGNVPSVTFKEKGMPVSKCILGETIPRFPAPSNNYDVEIDDKFGCDIFGGELNDRSATIAQQALPKIGNAYNSRICTTPLTFKLVGNSVNAAQGKCILYFEIKDP